MTDASGLSPKSIRSSEGIFTRRCNEYTYNITCITPRQPKDNCVHCSSPITLDDCSHRFILTEENIADRFKTIHQATKLTGLSYDALKNACKKGNEVITLRRRGSLKPRVFQVTWNVWCRKCCVIKNATRRHCSSDGVITPKMVISIQLG